MSTSKEQQEQEIEVVKEFAFDAAHHLPGYVGKCRDIHGHRWVLQIGFQGPMSLDTGMVVDFSQIKELVQSMIIGRLDHTLLNDVHYAGFPNECPTAERMVIWIKQVLPGFAELFSKPFPRLIFVRLYETPTSYAQWRGGVG